MSKEEFMHLQHSESVVAQMAATVFAGLVQQQGTTPADDEALIARALGIALKLALQTEKLVQSDQEWVRKDASSLPVVG